MKFKLEKIKNKKEIQRKKDEHTMFGVFSIQHAYDYFLVFWLFGGLGFDLSLSPWERGTLLITHDDRSTISISNWSIFVEQDQCWNPSHAIFFTDARLGRTVSEWKRKPWLFFKVAVESTFVRVGWNKHSFEFLSSFFHLLIRFGKHWCESTAWRAPVRWKVQSHNITVAKSGLCVNVGIFIFQSFPQNCFKCSHDEICCFCFVWRLLVWLLLVWLLLVWFSFGCVDVWMFCDYDWIVVVLSVLYRSLETILFFL